jgi:hypothetical protein
MQKIGAANAKIHAILRRGLTNKSTNVPARFRKSGSHNSGGSTGNSGGSVINAGIATEGTHNSSGPNGASTLRWLGYGIGMFALGATSSSIFEQIETLDVWPIPEGYEEIYITKFKPCGWSKYHFSQLINNGDVIEREKGMAIYNAGEYNQNNKYMVIEGIAEFVMVDGSTPRVNITDSACTEDGHVDDSESDPEVGVDLYNTPIPVGANQVSDEEINSDTNNTNSDTDINKKSKNVNGIEIDDADAQTEAESNPSPSPLPFFIGGVYPGQFDTSIGDISSNTDTDTIKAKKHSQTKADGKKFSKIALIANTEKVKVLRIGKNSLDSMLNRSSAIRIACLTTDRLRQAETRSMLEQQLIVKQSEVDELEGLITEKLKVLLNM